MRGRDRQTGKLFSYVSPDGLVPQDHPLRAIRALVKAALDRLSADFSSIYAQNGRPSIPPAKLLRALLLQALFSVRSERQLAAILADPKVRPLLSTEHFSVDGTLIEAWASMKSFRPKDGGGEPPAAGRNGERDFHGEKRSNETHASTSDPNARLLRKSAGQSAKLCHMAHVLMETATAWWWTR